MVEDMLADTNLNLDEVMDSLCTVDKEKTKSISTAESRIADLAESDKERNKSFVFFESSISLMASRIDELSACSARLNTELKNLVTTPSCSPPESSPVLAKNVDSEKKLASVSSCDSHCTNCRREMIDRLYSECTNCHVGFCSTCYRAAGDLHGCGKIGETNWIVMRNGNPCPNPGDFT